MKSVIPQVTARCISIEVLQRGLARLMKTLARTSCQVLMGCICASGIMAASEASSDWQHSIDLRYRLEIVDDDRLDRTGTASTARLRLGLTSPNFSGFRAGVMVHGNQSILRERFNSTANGKTAFPVVADPDDEGVSQAWLQYQAGETLTAIVGRQRITEDNHRFIGNVGFRQLEQTFDAITLAWKPGSQWQIDLRYLDRARRVFGRSNANRLLARADLDAWMTTISRDLGAHKIALYAHRLVFDDRPASHRNLGLRFTGDIPGSDKLEYRVELARQNGLKQLSSTSGQNYLHLRLAGRHEGWHWFAGHERLEGDGEIAFQTPLATLHAHNGWTDQFLTTPADGLIDSYGAAGTRLGQWTALLKLHDFRADRGSDRFGNEYGLMLSRPLPVGLSLEIKSAYFDGRQRPDVGKLWLAVMGRW